ncbi:molybdopterin-guanine dinucleotide biosynthesis protein A [Methylobacterium sp. Leaf108]|nr:molybdopterin-guanine dinucleotide biosynthesis protein A [Methylobacterium sp. Leaf108]
METASPESAGSPEHRFAVGIIVVRRKLKGIWASHAWLPVAALPAIPATAPWTRLAVSEEEETFYAGAYEVALHPSETSHYRDNLVSGRPSLWVALRQVAEDSYEVAAVTADPYEGESMAEGIGEVVEAVPMPAEIQAKLAQFFEAFHVERVFHKRKRDRADPEALARQDTGRRRKGDT